MTPTERLQTLAASQPDGEVTKRQRGFAACMLEALFSDHAETRRRCLLLAAFDVDSVSELQPRQVRAILAWLAPLDQHPAGIRGQAS